MTVNLNNILLIPAIAMGLIFSSVKSIAGIPRPTHTVICVLENHGYQQVIGSTSAPYLNQLSSIGANMVEYYGLTHPSQPNYIMLFSGDNQGVTTDNAPVGTPFSTPNLAASLISSGLTFAGYSEDLPAIGSQVEYSGAYARKHSPWVHWQGTGTNQIPASCNQTLDNFPTDFNLLPDVSFVIPNLNNGMHDGVDPGRIETGDRFVYDYLSAYVTWAMNNNSLLIVLFDEDDNNSSNHVPCIFVGPMVQPGQYFQNGYHHYDMLRTIEDMYSIQYAGNSSGATPIEEIWSSTSGISALNTETKSSIYPNPVTSNSQITFENKLGFNGNAHLQIYDILGNTHSNEIINVKSDTRSIPFVENDLATGIYFYRVLNNQSSIASGKFIVE